MAFSHDVVLVMVQDIYLYSQLSLHFKRIRHSNGPRGFFPNSNNGVNNSSAHFRSYIDCETASGPCESAAVFVPPRWHNKVVNVRSVGVGSLSLGIMISPVHLWVWIRVAHFL